MNRARGPQVRHVDTPGLSGSCGALDARRQLPDIWKLAVIR
jgi:hypothetical protein